MNSIRVVIADDHTIVREGLRALIAAQPGLSVIGEASDGAEALIAATTLKPDVLLLDLSMPHVDGVEAAQSVARDCPDVRVLVLTMHEEQSYVARLLDLGVAGYLLKRTAAQELVRAIRVVAGGDRYVDATLAGRNGSGDRLRAEGNPGNHDANRAAAAGAAARLPDLTRSEREVLHRVAHGLSNGEIALAMELGVPEINAHKVAAMLKLGLRSRAALVRLAVSQGWAAEYTTRANPPEEALH